MAYKVARQVLADFAFIVVIAMLQILVNSSERHNTFYISTHWGKGLR